jgi:hypothetical protein
MLRTTTISLAPKDMRRDRRHIAPPLTVRVVGRRYVTRNWSLGGFLLDEAPPLDVGAQLIGQILLPSGPTIQILAEAIRRDEAAGTLAFRFINPTPALVIALDHAVAVRLSRRRGQAARIGLAALAALIATAMPARADGALVPGAAPLPEFRINFPDLVPAPIGPPPPSDLSISVTSRDHSVIHFLFSPRSEFGTATDLQTGTMRSYAGVSWNLFDKGGFYGNLGFAGAVTQPGLEDTLARNWRYFGPPLALHSTFEIGYQLGDGHSLTLSLDRASEPSMLSDRYELDNFTLRYGLKF